MPRLIQLVFLCLILALAAGCAPSIQVDQDWDDQIDFMGFKSFQILEPRGVADDLVARRLVNSVNVHLTERGYVADAENPEMVIAIHTNVQDKVDIQSWGYTSRYPYRYGGSDVTVSQYTEGTLIIDLIEAQKMELFWRGWGTTTVSNSTRDPAALQDIVDKILAQFPPR